MEKLKPVKKLPLNFDKSSSLKDFSVERILELRPELGPLLADLIPHLPQKKFITVDYSELNLKKGSRTCKDPRWHVDGVDNQYIILNFGISRTRFLNQEVPEGLSDLSGHDNLKELNSTLADTFKHEQGSEIPDGVPVLYSSKDIHKGNVSLEEGKRILLRICASDYLRPKNVVLIK